MDTDNVSTDKAVIPNTETNTKETYKTTGGQWGWHLGGIGGR